MDYGTLESIFGEPVTTSATGTPQRASEVAANMTIITADEIRQSGSRSIPEILSQVPGLDILQESANSWDVGVRGYQQPFQPRLLVLIDGRQVFNDDYSRMEWATSPLTLTISVKLKSSKAQARLYLGPTPPAASSTLSPTARFTTGNVASVSLGTQNEMTGDATATAGLANMAASRYPQAD